MEFDLGDPETAEFVYTTSSASISLRETVLKSLE